jgi:hypothetical protein
MPGRFRWLILTFWLVSLTACAPAAPAPTSAPAPVTTKRSPKHTPTGIAPVAAAATAGSVSTAAPPASGGGAQVPGSCSAIVALVGAYTGGVATTKSLGSPQHLSCEFANANASIIVVVNIGAGGTAAAFDSLRTTSAQGGRTVKAISGLGASAFSVSKNNTPAGVSVLTAGGLVYVVDSNLTIAQDEALIEQLMKLS